MFNIAPLRGLFPRRQSSLPNGCTVPVYPIIVMTMGVYFTPSSTAGYLHLFSVVLFVILIQHILHLESCVRINPAIRSHDVCLFAPKSCVHMFTLYAIKYLTLHVASTRGNRDGKRRYHETTDNRCSMWVDNR